MFLNCPSCKHPVEVTANPPAVQNFETVSQILIEHAGQTACRCGAVFFPAIVKLGEITFAPIPVPPEKQKTIVVPATRLPT